MFLPVPVQAQEFDSKVKRIDISSKKGPVLGQDSALAYAKRANVCARLYKEPDFLDTPALQEAVYKVMQQDKYTFSNGWKGSTDIIFDEIVESAISIMED